MANFSWMKLLEEKAAAIVCMLCVTALTIAGKISSDLAVGVLMTAAGLATTGSIAGAMKGKGS